MPHGIVFVCLFLSFILSFPACFHQDSLSLAAARENVFLVGNPAESANLGPQTISVLTDQNIMMVLFEGLTVLNKDELSH